MSRLARNGTVEPVSPDQIFRRERGKGNTDCPCSTDHEQDWQPYTVDPHACYMCDHKYIHKYIHLKKGMEIEYFANTHLSALELYAHVT